MKKALLQFALAVLLASCGGGSDLAAPSPVPQARLVGEVFGTPEQVQSAEILSNIGYSGNLGALETARAIEKSGRANMLDFLFLFPIDGEGSIRLVSNAESSLDSYIAQHNDLLLPGVHLYLIDEMYLRAAQLRAGPAEYAAQLADLVRGIALVRRKLPLAKLGVSFSPYAQFSDPAVGPFIQQAISQVDWIGSTAYWLGDEASIPALHAWSRALPGIAKTAQPNVETWYIAQAFRDSSWDKQLFRDFIQTELKISDTYDAIMFFGWQETSELPEDTAGRFFEPETRAIYEKFLKQ